MFNPQHKLKTLLLCLAALFCAGTLGAQDIIIVGIAEPLSNVNNIEIGQLKQLKDDVRSAFTSAVVKTRGFQVIDQARANTISREYERQAKELTGDETRRLNEKGVDYLLVSEISINEFEGGFIIKCEIIHLETKRIVGSDSRSLAAYNEQARRNTGKSYIANVCEEMISGILELVNRNALSGNSKRLNETMLGENEDDGDNSINDDIIRAIENNRTNKTWNSNRKNYTLGVETSRIRFNERREHGINLYKVSGIIKITMTNKITGYKSETEVEIKEFTERNKELVRLRLMEQVKSKTSNIIKDLLADQVGGWDR